MLNCYSNSIVLDHRQCAEDVTKRTSALIQPVKVLMLAFRYNYLPDGRHLLQATALLVVGMQDVL